MPTRGGPGVGTVAGMDEPREDQTEKKKAPFSATILFVIAIGLLVMLMIGIFAL